MTASFSQHSEPTSFINHFLSPIEAQMSQILDKLFFKRRSGASASDRFGVALAITENISNTILFFFFET